MDSSTQSSNNTSTNQSPSPPSTQTTTPSTQPTSTTSPSTSKKNRSKKISNEESKIISSVFEYHNGDWFKILNDQKIKQLGRQDSHIRNHIDYLRRKKNVIATGERGSEKRKRIVEEIDSQLADDEDEGSDLDVTVGQISQQDPLASDQNPRTTVLQEPTSPRLRAVHNVDKDSFEHTVSSSEVSTSQDYNEFVEASKKRQKQRHEAIQRKRDEKNEQLNDIREQRQERKESNDMKQMMMMMMMQQQQQHQQYLQQFLQQQQQSNQIMNIALLKLLGQKKKVSDENVDDDDDFFRV